MVLVRSVGAQRRDVMPERDLEEIVEVATAED